MGRGRVDDRQPPSRRAAVARGVPRALLEVARPGWGAGPARRAQGPDDGDPGPRPEGDHGRAGAGVDDRSRRTRDEDGRSGLPAGVQRPVCDGHGRASDRGPGRHQCRGRSGAVGGDGRPTADALRAPAEMWSAGASPSTRTSSRWRSRTSVHRVCARAGAAGPPTRSASAISADRPADDSLPSSENGTHRVSFDRSDGKRNSRHML
jgi:hypothetical protein